MRSTGVDRAGPDATPSTFHRSRPGARLDVSATWLGVCGHRRRSVTWLRSRPGRSSAAAGGVARRTAGRHPRRSLTAAARPAAVRRRRRAAGRRRPARPAPRTRPPGRGDPRGLGERRRARRRIACSTGDDSALSHGRVAHAAAPRASPTATRAPSRRCACASIAGGRGRPRRRTPCTPARSAVAFSPVADADLDRATRRRAAAPSAAGEPAPARRRRRASRRSESATLVERHRLPSRRQAIAARGDVAPAGRRRRSAGRSARSAATSTSGGAEASGSTLMM